MIALDASRAPEREQILRENADIAEELKRKFEAHDLVDRITRPFRSADEQLPRMFGDYELLAWLGEGGMGVIYRARKRGLDRVVALKMIRSGPRPSAQDIRRFHVEAGAVMSLDHPQIVPLYDFGECDGYPFFTMKLFEGGTLEDHLDRFKKDPKAAAQLVEELARAVEHAHNRGILHRDLKPGNILFDSELHLYIADWGLAKQLKVDRKVTQTGVAFGTPEYMAPEQLKGTITTKLDIYSLGVILYELLTGHVPFPGKTFGEIIELVLQNDPAPPRVDRNLDAVCLKCLERQPDDRYRSAKELADDLRRWLEGKPVMARPVGGAIEFLRTLMEREAEIVVAQLADLTGPTSSIGKPYAEGVQAYTDSLNAKGGINSKKVRLVSVDYANKVADAVDIYARFKTMDRVVAIQGWGTGDTEALSEQVSQDQIPYFSASYSAHLADPKKAPYNFFIAADYSTQLRAGLEYFREGWKEPRKPRVAFVYPNLSYGWAPIPAGKKRAEELGFEIVGEENVALNAIEADAQMLDLRKKDPDLTWIGGSTPSTALILIEARKLGFRTRFLINIWGNDEDLIKRAGDAAEGVLGLQASVLFGDDVPGMEGMLQSTRGERVTHYVRGWVSMMVLCEGLRRAEAARELTGSGIRKSLETLRHFETQGLTQPITFTPDDHRPNMAVRVYEYRGGRMLLQAKLNLERRPEWLGF